MGRQRQTSACAVSRLLLCPHCGGRLRVEDSFAGQVVVCAQCGGQFHAAPDRGEVIDAHAEPINSGDSYSQREEEVRDAGPPAPVEVIHERERFSPGETGYYRVRVDRGYTDNSGCCCAMGCGLLVLLAMIFLRGCVSLFL